MFDLDDTLYAEEDFVASGFRAVARWVNPKASEELADRLLRLRLDRDADPFGALALEFSPALDKTEMLRVYRTHRPSICLAAETARLMQSLVDAGCHIGVLTDGRSSTQRNKIAALGLDRWVDLIGVSEEIGSMKPSEANYRLFSEAWPGLQLAYVGDNLAKDFVTPNRLGWQTVGLVDQGRNIHSQATHAFPPTYHPRHWVRAIA